MEKEVNEIVLDEIERNHWKTVGKRMLKDWRIYLMALPLIFFFICWRYLPMSGLLIAFKNYDGKSVIDSNWYGLVAFDKLMFGEFATANESFWKAFRNTFVLSFYGLCFGFPMPIILALLFSEIKNETYRSILQVLTYLPKFVSLVVVTTLVKLLCKESSAFSGGGPITVLLQTLGVISEETKLLYEPQYFRAIYHISGIWETAGYGSIVYFAAILSISPTSYEAARMDGASKWAQIRYVTFPGIASTLTIMLILEIGKLLTVGYEKVLLLYSDKTYETADVISTFVMRIGGMGDTAAASIGKTIASAADLFNSIIAMLLVIGSNTIAKRVSSTSLY